MSFRLKKNYDWIDLEGIPFSCNPRCTLALIGQKTLTGVVNVLWIPVEAALLNTAIACAEGRTGINSAYPLLVAMLLIIFWKRMGWNLGRLPNGKLRTDIEYQTRLKVTQKRAKLKYSLIEDSNTWELCQRISKEMSRNVVGILTQVCDFMLAMIRIIGVLIIIFAESPVLGGIMLVMTTPLVLVSIKSGQGIYKAFKKASENERRSEYLQLVLTGRDSLEERTLYSYTDYVNQKWNLQREKYRRTFVRAEAMQELRKAGSGVVVNLISTVIVFFLALELRNGRLNVGIFIALSKAIYDMINLMYNELGYSIAGISRSMAFFKDLTMFANLEEVAGAEDLPVIEQQTFRNLEFRDVSFRYPGNEHYILKHLNMTIEKGFHYAFVGENGAGKTTIIKLMLGLYEEYEGSILLNGKELREYAPAELKAMYTNVYQDFARYQDTVGNNIELGDIRSMGTAEAGERAEEKARKLGIYEEVKALPQGFQTPLGKIVDGGVELSGGQWQRIAFARSLMNPAPLQILDEPTAALDPISESRLYEELGKISGGRTTLFISHRLGSTKLADIIFVLKDGAVYETGSHKELMERSGLYAQMYENQKDWYELAEGRI